MPLFLLLISAISLCKKSLLRGVPPGRVPCAVRKRPLDVAFGVALGSSTQIALFVIPVMVVIGWVIQQPLDLFFGPFPTAVTFLSTNLVFMVVQNGETNWLEGAMLLMTYLIICIAFFFFVPDH